MQEEKSEFGYIKYIIIGVVALILLFVLWPFKVINSDERGLLFKFGAVQDTILQPGIHFRIPIYESIKAVSIQPIQLDHNITVGKDGAITKDNQTIGADLTVFYKYKPELLPVIYKQYSEEKIQSIMTQSLRESFKAQIGIYDIFKLPTIQDEIRGKVYATLIEKMAGYPVEVTELKVVNYDWSDEFDAQIKTTMEKAQQVKQAEQELLITQQTAQKKVKEAEADKQAIITKAEGEKEATKLQAEAKALEGDGIKRYNASVATNWDIELKKMELEIAKIKAERWNGVNVPNNMYGPIPVDTNGGIKQ